MRSGPKGPLFFYRCGLNIPDKAKLLSGTGLDALAAIPAAPRMAMSGMAGMDHSMPMASAPAGAPGHSGRAMPGIEALYKKVDKSKVAFVMFSLDDDQAKVRKFVKNRGYTFLVYLRTGDLAAPFDSNSIPVHGHPRSRWAGGSPPRWHGRVRHAGIQSFAGAVGKNR